MEGDVDEIAQPVRIVIDGHTYQLRPWSWKDARSWGFRLFSLFVRPGESAFSGGTIGAALANLDASTYEAYCALVEKYTDVVSEDGTTVKPLSAVAAKHMCGRLPTWVELVRAHTEREFGPFFDALKSALKPSAESASSDQGKSE